MIGLLPRSLKRMVPLSLLGFAAALSLLNIVYHEPLAERAVEEDDRDRLFQDLSRLQSSLEYLLLKGDMDGAQREVAILAFNHDYTVAVLTDDRNTVIAATRRAWLGRPVTAVLQGFDFAIADQAAGVRRARIDISSDRRSLLAYAAVQFGGSAHEFRSERIGRLYLEYDLRRSKAKALKNLASQSVYWSAWVTGLALVLWIAFHFLLTRRTDRLVRAAEQFASGNLTARGGLAGHDELARLSRAFDAMAQQVGETQVRLREDLAERARTEALLRASEASYRVIFDAAEDAIFVFDIESGATVDVNQKACLAYGFSKDELLRIDLAGLSTGRKTYTREDAMLMISRAARGEQLHFERHRRDRDGHDQWDEVSLKRVTIGGVDRVLGLTRQVTARKVAEEALRASEEQYRAVFNASIDGLALRDAWGALVDVNPAMRRMYGYADGESFDLLVAGAHHPSIREVLATGRTTHTELVDTRKDGSALALELYCVPVQYQGKPHVLTIARDITEKKRAAEELAQEREKTYQREKLAALGSLLAGVAHELNNPLSVVVARAVMLEERGDAATHGAAYKIRAAAERCARIVRTFLSMARQHPPKRVPVNVNSVVQAALELTGYTLRTSGVAVDLDLAEDLPAILADADQLHQVYMNLIVNAQQALQDRGPPRLLKVSSRYDAASDRVIVAVADNGAGIPYDIRSRIFEPYFTTKARGAGIGVGLAVSLGIVEAHGGTLSVECPDAGGTVFSTAMPPGHLAVVDADNEVARLSDDTRHAVLVVDDEQEVRQALREILEAAGHRVVTASSGREALDRIGAEHYDVIVTDMRMPDLDGRGLYREIERRWPERSRRVVFVTGDTLTSSLREYAEDCGRPVIEKPFLPGDIRRAVAETARDGRRLA